MEMNAFAISVNVMGAHTDYYCQSHNIRQTIMSAAGADNTVSIFK